ncbi:hypothetical protein E2542_SST03691 [Spatholobus suberectus]|nr:hypothetical protein E2542_SST03691 [Spatholobus suberectus]
MKLRLYIGVGLERKINDKRKDKGYIHNGELKLKGLEVRLPCKWSAAVQGLSEKSDPKERKALLNVSGVDNCSKWSPAP